MKKVVFTFIIAAFMLNILSVQAAEPPKNKKDKQENVLNDKKNFHPYRIRSSKASGPH